MKFNCTGCGQRLVCEDELAGQVVKCPQCAERLTIPEPEEPPPAQKAAAPAAKTPAAGAKNRAGQSSSAAKGKRKRSPSQYKRRQKWSDNTNVSMIISGLIGTGMMLAYYLLLFPVRNFYFGQLFYRRGWVPSVLVLLMGWSVGFLILKVRKLSSQKNALLLDLLPEEIAKEIDSETVDDFIEHVHRMPARLRESFMVYRIRRGLEHFAVRGSNPEVANLMTSQSEIDAAAVHSSYSIVKVFIWAIPILGFIGTVLGISNAVGGFSEAMDQAQDIEVLKTSLNGVTSGLSVAFDTTLVALVMSLLVCIPVSIIQKREEDFLGKVDEYCSENLLKRLNDAGGVADVASHTQVMMQALGQAMAQDQGGILSGLKDAQDRMAEVNAEQIRFYGSLNASMTEQTDLHRRQVEQDLGQMAGTIQKSVLDMTEQVKALVENQVKASVENAEQHQKKVAELLEQLSGPIDESSAAYVKGLTESLDRMNKVLKDLGEKQVEIHQVVKKRGWFFSRKA